MPKFEPGTWVWITDERERYLPAKVLKTFTAGDAAVVRTEDGEDHQLSAAMSAQVTECNEEALNSKIEDLINISDLNEMSILHNLRIRFKEDKIYTNISSILISVNPFKLLPLYTPEMLERYRNGIRGLSPHVFATAYSAYHNMLGGASSDSSSDQSVVISGESGAGKSEATKLILQFLTDVSSRSGSAHTSASSSLEQQILAANPILEAFGNAKTLRNNNSSRFGKLITVNFDKNGSITGGGIINYLLEKSRVVSQTKGERNYHIFYQLLASAGAMPELAAELKLQDPAMFDYTNPGRGGVTEIEGHYDDKEFEDMHNSMDILQFGDAMKKDVFKIVSGVLHFGNVKFRVEKKDTGDDGSSVANPEVAAHAAAMWGVDPAAIAQCLTSRTMGTREVIYVAYNVLQAQDARDAMTKRVYAELFQQMVDKINSELSATGAVRHKFIGVLDIFGFESFEVNSFEQLCINFCNEKLQFHFNEHIFKMEQTLYAAEGIVIPGSTFVDNQPTLDLLELKTTGIFSMIDEEINVPKGSDEGLLAKLLTKHADGKHPNMLRPKAKECKDHPKCFGVLHYAGPVYYNTTNFLDKNKDQLHPDIVNALRASKISMIASMFPPDPAEVAGSRGSMKLGKPRTLGGQFKTQLNDLIATLNSTFPHFVRCMKSNDEKKGNIFTAGRMQDQLRYAGLVEVCRIRKLGFPVRRPFDEFFKRFRCCLLTAPNLDELIKFLAAQKMPVTGKPVLVQGEWAKGKTRIFLRTAQAADLELFREHSLIRVAVVVQKYGRRMLARSRIRRFRAIIVAVRDAVKKREEQGLKEAIDTAFELPWNGGHLAVVREAKTLLARVREENLVFRLMENGIATHDLNALKSAISAAAKMVPPLTSPLVAQAQQLAARLEAELAVKAGLAQAITARSVPALTEWIAKAQQLQLAAPELQQAVALKTRLEEEVKALAALKDACAKRDISAISAVLGKCVDLGIASHPEVVAAEKIKAEVLAKESSAAQDRIKQEEAAAAKRRGSALDIIGQRLHRAMAARDLAALHTALQEATQQGMPQDKIDEAQALVDKLHLADDARSLIAAALGLLSVRAAVGVSSSDIVPLSGAVSAAEKIAAQVGDFSELVEAKAALAMYQNHVIARAEIDAAVASKDRVRLRAALDLAENNNMDTPNMAPAKVLMRELQQSWRSERIAAGEVPDDEPYDAAEEARKKRQALAKQAKFEIKNFDRLRSADDFAKGALMNKQKVKDAFLTFQPTKILKSLTVLNVRDSKTALEMFLDLLGYMGDKQMPFPAMLAQDVLRKGSDSKSLRDEIYLQVIKQLSSNPRPESVAKGWQIMCMCVGTFPPSADFEFYLMHYIIEKSEKGRGAVVDYAKYCLRTLEAMLSHSQGETAGFVPQVDEILAYKERPPILATIFLVDGKPIAEDLPITPDVNVGKVLELCTHWLTLTDPRISTLGIFVYDMGEVQDERYANDPLPPQPYSDLQRTPRPLRSEDYMGDIIVQKARQRRMFKFVLKKKIFLPQHVGRGSDQFYERLIYLQAEDDAIIQGSIDIPDAEMVSYLATISMLVAFPEGSEEAIGNAVSDVVAAGVVDFIAPAWRSQQPPEDWAKMILEHRPSLASQPIDDLQDIFLQLVQENPLYGTHWFYVHKVEPPSGALVPEAIQALPRELMLGFNADGMHVFDRSRQCLCTIPYGDIYRWGGSSSQFSLIMADDHTGDSFEFVIITAQAADMAATILDHIKAVMAEQFEDEGEGELPPN